jgi:hypothetical protein
MRAALFAIGSILVSTLTGNAGAAGTNNACKPTASAIQRACQAEALGDYQVELAKCRNIADPAERKAREEQAAADYKDARESCKEQFEARLAACEQLGSAPYDPVIQPTNFVSIINNPYFPLTPGTKFTYEGQTANGFEHSEFAVTHQTKVILGVTCVEVRDTVYTDGKLTEDTLDWFAQDKDGNVWYFGENTHELEDGLITTIDGSFIAGVNGDKPGIVMKAHPAIGDFYRQEFSLGNAEDFAETISLTESVTVPTGSYNNCLKSQETTPLETDLLEYKFYAPGVGNVLTIDANTGDMIKLIQITTF